MDQGADAGRGDHQAPLLSSIKFEDLVIGRRFGPFVERVSAAMADRLRGEIGVVAPGSLAGPGVFPVLFLKVLRRAMGGVLSETVLAKQEFEFHTPVPVDTDVSCHAWVGNKYVRRNRSYLVMEFEIHNSNGELALTGRKVILWPEPVDRP